PQTHTHSLHDALPISNGKVMPAPKPELSGVEPRGIQRGQTVRIKLLGSKLEGVSAVKSNDPRIQAEIPEDAQAAPNQVWINLTTDRKSTRLNSSHEWI